MSHREASNHVQPYPTHLWDVVIELSHQSWRIPRINSAAQSGPRTLPELSHLFVPLLLRSALPRGLGATPRDTRSAFVGLEVVLGLIVTVRLGRLFDRRRGTGVDQRQGRRERTFISAMLCVFHGPIQTKTYRLLFLVSCIFAWEPLPAQDQEKCMQKGFYFIRDLQINQNRLKMGRGKHPLWKRLIRLD